MATAKHKYKVLVLFDTAGTPPPDQDFSAELKTDDWAAEAHVIGALRKLGHELRTIGVWDEPGMIIDEIKNYPPDVVFFFFKQKTAYEIHAPVDAVGAVDIGEARRAEHHPVAWRRPIEGMRGRLGVMISLD